ncbi:class I SAM-dependent methyltransferase [Streptomyces sp. NPDC002994]|uniref:class I SAM-dependent methyltransferase n=1 Tax=Streptomyces sp. NPDC002994 TaxID=3154441 RepID=UPI0033AD1E54
MTEQLTSSAAAEWIRRWDLQQERYAIDREERFTVIADVVEHATAGQRRPLVADLGCGPGSLTARLAARRPEWEIVAVDTDPLLLELGRRHCGTAARFVDVPIGSPGWIDALALGRPLDAAVSATALHYLPEPVLLDVYEHLHSTLRPGGVIVNADHFFHEGPLVAPIAQHVGRRRAGRLGVRGHEDWQSWWAAADAAPELAGLMAERRRRRLDGDDNGLSLDRHTDLLRKAGFAEAGPVWQYGHSCVLVAVA